MKSKAKVIKMSDRINRNYPDIKRSELKHFFHIMSKAVIH